MGEDDLKKARQKEEEWQKSYKEKYQEKLKFELPQSYTESGIPLKPHYTPLDIAHIDFDKIGVPGSYPYIRGIYPLTYQYTPWMTQQIHGFAKAEETRVRTQKLEKEGMSGFQGRKVFFLVPDLASGYGYDPDHPSVRGMVGVSGVSVSSEEDLDILCSGYDLSKTRVGLSTKTTCLPILALYLAYAEKRGYKPNQLTGQSQNRRKISWLGENTRDHSPRHQLKLQVELIKYCAQNMPLWNHTNLCGYIAGENFLSPAQEMAVMLAEAIELTESGIKAGLNPDDFVSRFSAQMHVGMDFFEEVAKLRVFRKMWAKTMKERFDCKKPASYQFRIHVHTGGINLTAQQPLNNIIRTTLQVLASIFGSTQSVHATAYDEAIGLPSEEAATTALRISQIILHETGIPKISDPFGGSYFMEWLTDKLEEESWKFVNDIEDKGGFTKCMETGWLWNLFDWQARKWRKEIEEGKRVMVGVNKYADSEFQEIEPFKIDQSEVEKVVIERIKKWKANRDQEEVKKALKQIEKAAREFETVEQAGILMPVLIQAARAKCTLGEMMSVLFEVYGTAYPY